MVSHFLRWEGGSGRGQVGVGEGVVGLVLVGVVSEVGVVQMCMTRGHIFWCHTFWGGGLAGVRVVWVRVGGRVGVGGGGGGDGGVGWVGQGGLYEFYVLMCILSQEQQQQQYTSLLLTGLLTGVSR